VELKDVILSTLSEIGEDIQKSVNDEISDIELENNLVQEVSNSKSVAEKKDDQNKVNTSINRYEDPSWIQEECQFLENLRERLLVLFEGFQSPNNKSVESKIDLTLNFLEYLLTLLDERITKLKKL